MKAAAVVGIRRPLPSPHKLPRPRSAAAGARRARVYARDASTATEEYVRESPWTAVGLAAAVGVLIGFIASRPG